MDPILIANFSDQFFLTKKRATLPRNSLLRTALGNFAPAEVLHRPVRSPRQGGQHTKMGPAINGVLRPLQMALHLGNAGEKSPLHLITGDGAHFVGLGRMFNTGATPHLLTSHPGLKGQKNDMISWFQRVAMAILISTDRCLHVVFFWL